MEDALKIQIDVLPQTPGVYQYYDKTDTIIYVGKAKNLRKRVRSYFNKTHDYGKTRILVSKIKRIEHIVVDTETDALLLENNLIKKYKPRYNVLLKDDKSYPWICIKKERFPRVFVTRRIVKDGSSYFGPYTSMKTVHTLMDLIRGLYPLRSCTYDLSPEKINNSKYKLCLEYHIGNCKGACEAKETAEDYTLYIQQIRKILNGNFGAALKTFRKQMQELAAALEFEEAQRIKEKIEILENYQAKSTIISPKISNVDVFSIVSDMDFGFVNFMQINFGAIVRSHTIELKKKLGETDKALLEMAVLEIRQRFEAKSKEILVPFALELPEEIRCIVPQLGDKKRIVELSERNAKFFRLDRYKQIKLTDPERHSQRILQQLQKDLRLSQLPTHIECFDNSNIQGTHPVAACVVFRDAKPYKKDYRHYNIKTVVGPDDFASMEEVVYRRYKRLLDEEKSLPQLIVIDGGKGQLSSALKSLDRLELRSKIAIIGIAKRLEEIYFPGDSIPIYLDKKSESLKTIQHLRNEAHRFGISFHRNKRSKAAVGTQLERIEGIGKATANQLLQAFKSVKRIKEASKNALTEVVGPSKAAKVYFYYHPDNKERGSDAKN
ncbi:MAG: excinuclease ABC subunit UvrC [Flavobacteriaceae bacterium]|nr:excinuclease ABC subunit UvrC [Flavobacteriaceae bacterium]